MIPEALFCTVAFGVPDVASFRLSRDGMAFALEK